MARPLVLNLDGEEFPVSIRKIDRDQLYGSVEIEAFDEKGNPASLLVLAAAISVISMLRAPSAGVKSGNGDSRQRELAKLHSPC